MLQPKYVSKKEIYIYHHERTILFLFIKKLHNLKISNHSNDENVLIKHDFSVRLLILLYKKISLQFAITDIAIIINYKV